MLVYPRLPGPTAELLAKEMNGRSLEDLRATASTAHEACIYAPTGGSRATSADISNLQERARAMTDACGWPDEVGSTERVRFDRELGAVLHEHMRIVPADAAEAGVWAFLTCVVLPDVACWRFPNRTAERLLGGPRNTLRRLWWRVHALDNGSRSFTRELGEDEIVQLMERPSLAGNPRVARALAQAHLEVAGATASERRMHLMRDSAKRFLRITPVVSVDALDDNSLLALARATAGESGRALGLLDASTIEPPVARLLGDGSAGQDGAPGSAGRRLADAQDLPAGYRVLRLKADDEPGLSQLPLGLIRRAAIKAVEAGAQSADEISASVRDEFGVAGLLAVGEEQLLSLLLQSAVEHGWVRLGERGIAEAVAMPAGSSVMEGPLMRHSLTEIALIVSQATATKPADLAAEVTAMLGYTEPADPLARATVNAVAEDFAAFRARVA